MLQSLVRLIQSALGERSLSIRLTEIAPDASRFIPVESSRKGYRYEKKDHEVTIRRVDAWASIAGLPPPYYFRGILTFEVGGSVLSGRVVMSTLPKCFVLAWSAIVLIAFLGTLLWSVLLAGQFMLTSSLEVKENLTSAGFLVGGTLGVGVFGVLVIAIVRAISRTQRQKLIRFLEERKFGL